jgi:hypothetical protein
MALSISIVTVINLAFDLAIICFGIFASKRRKSAIGFWIGAGFCMFAISYVITILGYGSVNSVLVPLRAIGYLAVIAGLYLFAMKK